MSEAKEPSQWAEFVKYANNSPTLLSLLYDLDLMPEQVKEGGSDHAKMLCIIAHFRSATEGHAPASRLWVSRREHEQEVARLKAQIAELERQLAWFLKNEKIPE